MHWKFGVTSRCRPGVPFACWKRVSVYGCCAVSVVTRLKPLEVVRPPMRLVGDDPQPGAPSSPNAPESVLQADCQHLIHCQHCGVLNGRSVKTCWGCEAELPVVPPSIFTFNDELGIAVNPEGPDRSLSTEEPTDDAAEALAARRLKEADRAHVDPESPFPLLTAAIDDEPSAAVPLVRSPPRLARWQIMVLLFALVSVAGVAAYFHIRDQISENQGVSVMSRSAVRSSPHIAPQGSVQPGSANPVQSEGLTRSMPIDAAPTTDGAAIAADGAAPPPARGPVVESDIRGVLTPETPPAVPSVNRPVRVGSRETRASAVSVVPTERRAGTSRDANRLPNPAGAAPMPAPNRAEPVREAPGSLGPCTAAVAALGLCTAPSVQPRERP